LLGNRLTLATAYLTLRIAAPNFPTLENLSKSIMMGLQTHHYDNQLAQSTTQFHRGDHSAPQIL